jgi:hypothetical protein
MLGYNKLMYVTLRGLFMDGQASLTLTCVTLISLRKCSLHMGSIFTAEHVFSRMVTPSHALSRNTLYSRFRTVHRLYDSC